MSDFLVYLAGPIDGLTYGEGQNWRDYMANILPNEIKAVSPLRGKSQRLARAGVITGSYEDNPLTSQAGLTARDHFDCRRSDAIIMNLLGAKKVSIGTMIEAGWASAYGKILILVMEKQGNIHDHPMLRQLAAYRVESLEQAAFVAEAVVLPEGKGTYSDRYGVTSKVSSTDESYGLKTCC